MYYRNEAILYCFPLQSMGYGSRAIQQLVDYYSGALMSLEMGEEEKDKDIPLYTDGPVGPRDLQKPLLCALPLER